MCLDAIGLRVGSAGVGLRFAVEVLALKLEARTAEVDGLCVCVCCSSRASLELPLRSARWAGQGFGRCRVGQGWGSCCCCPFGDLVGAAYSLLAFAVAPKQPS